jgi:putative flavoprotein involved in K+ transport
MPSPNTQHTQVLIIGAGPAGLGVAAALKQAGVSDLLVIDAKEVGASFRAWPKEMSFLTPSFYSNAFGLTDLNAITPDTSPADFLRVQHPSGPAYAKYLEAVVINYELPVQTGVHVTSIRSTEAGFCIEADTISLSATYVIWAGGQFSQPRDAEFPGAEHALHSSRVIDWKMLEGDEFTIIGGYESGVDAALHLLALGKSVRLVSRGEPWSSDDPDPSRSLSPRTIDRMRAALKSSDALSRIEFCNDTEITRIEAADQGYILYDQDDLPSVSITRPILANGFHSGLGVAAKLFAHDDQGRPIFTEKADESTITPGLFYSGPSLVHRDSLFCFVYKFRARFGVVAAEIAQRLALPNVLESLESYRKAGFMNTDLECCTNCECAMDPESTPPNPQ